MKNLFVLIWIALTPSIAFSSASILFTKGSAHVIRVNEKISLDKGMILNHGDSVITGNNGLVIIKSVASTYKVSKNSNLKLDLKTKEIINSSVRHGSVVVEFLRAKLRESKGKTLNVRSRSSVIGVRGTKFFTYVDRKEKNSVISVEHGSVSFRGVNATRKTLVSTSNSSMTNSKNEHLAARKLGFEGYVNWNLSTNKGSLHHSDKLFTALEKIWSMYKNENAKAWSKRSDEMESLWNSN